MIIKFDHSFYVKIKHFKQSPSITMSNSLPHSGSGCHSNIRLDGGKDSGAEQVLCL